MKRTMTRSTSSVFHSTALYDAVEVVRPDFTGQAHIPAALQNRTCRCARVLRWTLVEGRTYWQATCCGRTHYEVAR